MEKIRKIMEKLDSYGRLVMFSHTVFSLPFGLIAMLWAAKGLPRVSVFVYIFLALVFARNGANAFNRIADRKIDVKNERTAQRPLQTGRIKLAEAWVLTIFCFAGLFVCAYLLNPLCLILAPLAIGLFVFYSYSKRITWLCHFILGVCCGGAPVGAWIAVTGKFALVPFVLGAAVSFWICGFDIIYATQDIEFDRKEGLHSIPARFGLKGGLILARLSHLAALFFLGLPYFLMPERTVVYLLGVAAAAVLLVIEHYNVAPENKSKMMLASYHINQIVSVVFFAFAIMDFLIGSM